MTFVPRTGADPNEFASTFEYEPETGVFRWKVKPGGAGKKIGDRAGYVGGRGYWMLERRGKGMLAHRLAWFVMKGEMPASNQDIDHINGDPIDNRWENLRLCTRAQNVMNSKRLSHSRSPYKGITRRKSDGKWYAQISVDGERIRDGYYDTPEEAARRYDDMATQHFGEFACTNFGGRA